MQQQPRALEVLEEAHAQAGAGRRAFDQARNIGDDEASLRIDAHDPELRMQGRERIFGHFRPRGRQRTRERRLAGIRRAEEADVG